MSCNKCGADDWYIYVPQCFCAPCSNKRSRDKYQETRALALEHYGGHCQCCGEDEEAFLVIDHINGGGSKHIDAMRGTFYRWLQRNKFPDGFQVLCANCNMAKERPGGCPHLGQPFMAEDLSATKGKGSSF